MKSTKYIKFTALFLVGSIMLSCTEEEDLKPTATNSFTYSGNEYPLNDGYITEPGNRDPLNRPDDVDASHYALFFHITDGVYEITPDPNNPVVGDVDHVNAKYVLYLPLYYSSTSTFGNGEFTYVNEETATRDEIKNKSVFADASVWFDENGDGDWTYYEALKAVDGTVTAEGKDRNYTLFFELQLEDGRTLKGSYTAEFKYLKGR